MDFLQEFDEWILRKEQDRWERKSHYASDATSCRRQLYWRWTGEPESNPKTPGAMIKIEMGNAIETYITERFLRDLQDSGKLLDVSWADKVKVEIPGCEHPLSLKLDFAILYLDDDGNDTSSIVEVKSSFGRGIKEIQQKRVPKEANIVQAALYLEHFPHPQVIMPFFGRDNGYRTQFFLSFDDDHNISCRMSGVEGDEYETRIIRVNLDSFYDKFREIEDALKTEWIPDRDYMMAIKNGELRDRFQKNGVIYQSDWQCRYCAFKDRCWAELLPEFKNGDNSEDFAVHKEIKAKEAKQKPAPISKPRNEPDLLEEEA